MENILLKKVISQKSRTKDLDKLNYGILHSQYGFSDGVSIVMEQVEFAMMKHLNVPRENIFYLLGKSARPAPEITTNEIIWDKHPTNRIAINNYQAGLTRPQSIKIEAAINKAKRLIKKWVKTNKIDVILAHNLSHPVNFILSVAVSRFYKEEIENKRKVPQYILWWHDSHLERPDFKNPAPIIEEYVYEGMPGPFVDKFVFINSIQKNLSKKFMKKLDKLYRGAYKKFKKNSIFIYNTTDTLISGYEELNAMRFDYFVNQFLDDYSVNQALRKEGLEVDDTLFILQHTRIVKRKRIDIALKYAFELLRRGRKEKQYKGAYFLISGEDSQDGSKKEIKKLYKELCEKYNTTKLILAFTDENESLIPFKSYPKIFACLNGIGTYFSEIEGFGNNLLENLASGLPTVIYKYPVFKSDIAKFKFKLIETNSFDITAPLIQYSMWILKNEELKDRWVTRNLKLLKKFLSHKTIADKLEKLIDKKVK